MVKRVAWLLAFAGAIPFIVTTAALLAEGSHIRVPAIAAQVTYAAVILSFLGGIEWGFAVQESYAAASARARDRLRAFALVVSVLPSLAGWGVLWLPSPTWQLGASLGLFIFVWLVDLTLSHQGLVPAWFVDLRTAVTAVVAITLGVALWLL